jgi:adenylate cyclase
MRLLVWLRHLLAVGRGRPMALALLTGVCLLQAFPQHSPWRDGQLSLFDQYQRVFPRERESQPVVIVEIDEASLRQVGQWPWPRNRTAELIDAIDRAGALAIGLDIYMPEPDQTSPARVARNLPPGNEALARALSDLPSHERRLEQSLSQAPTVLSAAGFNFQTLTTSSGMRTVPLSVSGGDPLPHLRHYPYVLASLPELQAAASGQALVSVDLEDGVVRRIPLVAAINDQPVAGLAMEMLRVATDSGAVEVQVGPRGIARVGVADLLVPTQPNGEVWLHVAHADGARNLSAVDLLTGKVDPQRLRDKLVLVGLTGHGLSDMRTTALRELVPGVEIQAQLIESLFDGRFLLRPDWLRGLEFALLVGGGLFLVWAVPHVRARIATLLALGFYLVLFGAGFGLFRTTGLLLDAASVFAGLNVVFGSLLSSVFIETDRERRQAKAELQRQREQAARVAGELAAARRIQLGTLPQAATAFPGERRFELGALLEPARDVGGDLYDFFMLDERRLFFVIADVSGKGLPASLFMAATKALAKSAALRVADGVGAIVTTANQELSRDNPEALFVTMVAGVLDADSGEVQLCNAGHDAPWRLGRGAPSHVPGDGGPPLCVLDDFPYPETRITLAPGETLVLVTDGVTEAMDASKALYGSERLRQVLAGTLPAPGALVEAVNADVKAFVGDAEPADDLTLLALRFNGR